MLMFIWLADLFKEKVVIPFHLKGVSLSPSDTLGI